MHTQLQSGRQIPISIEERGEQSKICMPPFRLSERTGWTTMRISAEEMQCYSKANVSGNGVLLRGKCMYNIERQAVSQAFGKIGLLSRDTRLFIGKWGRSTRRLTSHLDLSQVTNLTLRSQLSVELSVRSAALA